MKTLNAIIIDDEQDSREILQNYITKYCDHVSVIGLCSNIIEGYESIEKYNPN